MTDSGQIEVSKKTLLHISEGIYRTEGSAIKELINNSFDANATKVVVSTNYPLFDILSCQDNGDGMDEKEFLRIVKGGIGDSGKAHSASITRPLIGRLGIGILAIAQVCRSFTIISHHKASKTAFRGSMIFRTDVDKVAKEEQKESYEIGKWVLEEEIEYNEEKKGVLIFTKDLRQSFIRRFKNTKDIKNQVSLDFDRLLDDFYSKPSRMIKEQGPYMELLWELCNLLPLPYYDGSPVRVEVRDSIEDVSRDQDQAKAKYKDGFEFLTKKQEELSSYNFNVVVDDIRLFRPIKLPYPIYNRIGVPQQSQLFYLEYEGMVRQRKLQFYGYFIAQEQAIKPRDLKGVQIRIKNVGIGIQDPTFLKYDKIESPRDNWLSGEIYIEQGLESALNIDRDSFNENDEHYFILKQEIHSFLGEVVFPKISQSQRLRNKLKKEESSELHKKEIKTRFKKFFKANFDGFEFEFTGDKRPMIDYETKKIMLSNKLISDANYSKMDLFSSYMLELIDYFRKQNLETNRIEKNIKEFSLIMFS